MINIGIGVAWKNNNLSSGGIVFDTDYQAVLNRAIALGYNLPSTPQQVLQNQLVLDLKASGVWSKLDVFYVFANDAENGFNFSYLNWKSPTQFEIQSRTTGLPVSWSGNSGFTGRPSVNQAYLDTGFKPLSNGSNYTLNNASRYIYVKTGGSASALDGTDGTVNNMQFSGSPSQRINSSNPLNQTFSFATGTPTKSIHRTNSTNVELFNGTVQTSRTQTSSTPLHNTNQYIFRNATTYGDSTVSMYAMGASLVSENTAFVNAINTYMTGL